MIIKSLTLQNFGVYEGIHKVIFPDNRENNIVVFIGNNGSGKTTLLDALKIVLYGPLIFGYKTANETYLSKIKQKINTNAYNKKKECSLELELTKIENSDEINYKIRRKWKINSKSLSEELEIRRNGNALSRVEIDLFENYFRQFLPPSLIDLFFFDGERLSYLSEKTVLQKKLEDSIDVIFNIEIFTQLIKDLNELLKQKEIDSELSNEEKKLRNKKEQSEILEEKIENLTNEIKEKSKKLTKITDDIQGLKEKLSIYGAVEKTKLIALEAKYKELEREKENLHRNRREILTNLLPFQISRNLLKQLKVRIKGELLRNQQDIIQNTLREKGLLHKAVKSALSEHMDSSNNTKKITETILNRIEKKLLTTSRKPNKDLQLTSFMSKDDIQLLDEIIEKTGSTLTDKVARNYKKINNINAKMSEIHKKIDLNLKNISFEYLFNEMENKKSKHFDIYYKIKEKEKELEIISKEKRTINKEVEKLDKQIDYINRSDTVSSITNKVIKVSSDFINFSRTRKLRVLEEKILNSFKILIRKNDLLRDIKLESDYQIRLYNGNSDELHFEQLSTGETQVFIISILWALIQLSKRVFPVVFDSFFGRLDVTHKERILKKYVPNSQKQVILLVNDNELNDNDLDVFSKYNPTKYYLKFNEKKNNTIIERI